ncbi:MAG: type II secretion system F family protein [Actinomycetes bacterium]
MNGWALASVTCALATGVALQRPRDVALRRLGARPRSAGAARTGGPVRRRVAAARARPRRWDHRLADRRRRAVVELADAVASELRAGATPRAAVLRAAQDDPLLAGVAAAARSPAGDVAGALHELGTLPGAGGATDLAAAWLVCESTGGGLATPAARLAGALRDEAQVRREVAAQLAGPRATAVLLAALPAFGLLMGAALGAHPVGLLLGTEVGRALLVPGLSLELVGILWTRRIARRASLP